MSERKILGSCWLRGRVKVKREIHKTIVKILTDKGLPQEHIGRVSMKLANYTYACVKRGEPMSLDKASCDNVPVRLSSKLNTNGDSEHL